MTTMLRRWWTKKYQLPWTPNYVGSFTLLDLLVEFYEDIYESDKSALFDAARGEDGEIVFESTGDPMIDKWEQEIAMGIEPDLTEGMSQADLDQLAADKEKARRAKSQFKELSGIEDKFNEGLMRNPRYRSVSSENLPNLNPLDLLGKGK